MNETFRKLTDVERLDNSLILAALAGYINECRVSLRDEREHHLFKSKYNGKLEALDEVMEWLVKYKQDTQNDVNKIEEFLESIFGAWFEGLYGNMMPEGYNDLVPYHARFSVPVYDEEQIVESKKKILSVVNGINETSFSDGNYGITAVIKVFEPK